MDAPHGGAHGKGKEAGPLLPLIWTGCFKKHLARQDRPLSTVYLDKGDNVVAGYKTAEDDGVYPASIVNGDEQWITNPPFVFVRIWRDLDLN
jgi:hypothetical protein